MWKPPERIKYSTAVDAWPDADSAQQSLLFSPLQCGRLHLEQRTWVPAMVPWRSNEAGEVTEDVLAWYERFAQGRPGAIVVEATGIRDIPSGPLLRIGDDRYIGGLRELAETVRRASHGKTRLFIQLIDFLQIRRRPDPQRFLAEFLVITEQHRQALGLPPRSSEQELRAALLRLDTNALAAVLNPRELESMQFGFRERVTDTERESIRDLPTVLPDLFARAAHRAETAGFDGVELHYAHAYTMASFLSATNTRTDGYGGDREGRLRLPLDVFAAVRAAVSESFVVGCRFLADEIIAEGSHVDDAVVFAQAFAEAGMDFLSLSRGGKFDDAKQPKVGDAAYPYTGRSGYECMPAYLSDAQGPFGRNLQPSARIRSGLREAGLNTPVVVAGGLYSFDQAESALRAEQGDIIGFARQALADPDWFEKVRRGRGGEVRLCRYSNYCEGLDQKHKQVTCELWDREALDEPGIRKSHDGRRRLIAPSWKA